MLAIANESERGGAGSEWLRWELRDDLSASRIDHDRPIRAFGKYTRASDETSNAVPLHRRDEYISAVEAHDVGVPYGNPVAIERSDNLDHRSERRGD
ncbi:MAG: hypothetical protein AB7O24_06255 [Kofleriaceae bacterium]